MSEASPRLRGLILTLTERCNLRCQYCYVPVERGHSMSRETANRAVAWFAAQAVEQGPLNLSFFGGEPFLARGEMRRIVDDARVAIGPGRKLRVLTPTNALALAPEDVAWCRREGIELAVSTDGTDGTGGTGSRRHLDGRDVSTDLARTIPELLRALPSGTTLARMTVTPANVARLCANLRAVAALGFERIVYLPDYLAGWDETALALWRREHERLATWLIGAKSAGRAVPDLPAWRAIEARLLRGSPRARCGAGVDQVTVSPDGDLFPCYRFAYADNATAWRLGHVADGFTEPDRLASLRAVDPAALRPEGRDCGTCSAKDGCTHFCPALGFLANGDIAAVPETACRLMAAQVASVRELCRHTRRAPPRTASPAWAAAAVVAAALTGLAGCENGSLPKGDAGDAPLARDVGIGGGICAVQINTDVAPGAADAGEATASEAGGPNGEQVDTQPPYGGGVCPVMLPDGWPTGGGIC